MAITIPTPCGAATWNVLPDGSGDAPTIQAAADSAAAGDSIVVWPGLYQEFVELAVDVVLHGQGGSSVTTLDAAGAPWCLRTPEALDALTIEGFTFAGAKRQGGFSEGYAVWGTGMPDGTFVIRDCVFGPSGERMGAVIWSGGTMLLEDLSVPAQGNGWDAQVDFWGVSGLEGLEVLTVDNCQFEGSIDSGGAIGIHGVVAATVTGCEFRHGGPLSPSIGFDSIPGGYPTILVERCLFLENPEAAVGHYVGPIGQSPEPGPAGSATVTFRENTVVRNDKGAFGDGSRVLNAAGIVERNVITGGSVGLWLPDGGTGFLVTCNNVFANGTNWHGIPDLTGVGGNLSSPPLYCDSAGGDFRVAANSPCLPQNNSCGARIGAFDEGCAPTSVESATWSAVKAGYR